ncbi:FAD:protein FMN transferase [Clostridium sp.]|uniref:FAD:protein FMN transferase n=1 Tax=Clostridium sp. TaxID=1506 RepID=UPI00284F1803|nr:FAD:protein FMN transferase [Clostridium sp.]MDR3597203.1 FAD:protein FMN transferase [Clostridium sp.]
MIAIIIVIILIVIFITGKYENNEIVKSSYALGTLINLRAYGSKAEKAIDEALERLNNIDDKMSAFKESSEISKINYMAGTSETSVGRDTYLVVKKAIEYSKVLEGTFDPTIRPLVKLWNIGTKEEKIPEEAEIRAAKKLVNCSDVILDESNTSIMLKHKNQALDVGGIAKGFAADEVRDIFLKHNIKSALIDLGGNIFALGAKQDNTPWRVGIQNPFKPRGEFIGILSVKNKSIVTSGNYERYFMKDGKRFHHIIDPKTGYPSESKIISATIISDNSIDGDGLSTGVYILGVDKALKIIDAIEGIDAIFVTEDKKVYMTSGVKDIFMLADDEFILN